MRFVSLPFLFVSFLTKNLFWIHETTTFMKRFHYTWIKTTGPSGDLQMKPAGEFPPDIQMMVTDVSLKYDAAYEAISREYASDLKVLDKDFGMAWYQLMSRDVGPRTRCLGDELPPIQPWEEGTALGPLSTDKPNYIPIRAAIQESIEDEPLNIAAFATLAIQCASTFRSSDYRGGCNGAFYSLPAI